MAGDLAAELLRRPRPMYAACTDKPKVELDKSARFDESLQPGTVMWECHGEWARHNRPSPCGAVEPVTAVCATEGSRKVVP